MVSASEIISSSANRLPPKPQPPPSSPTDFFFSLFHHHPRLCLLSLFLLLQLLFLTSFSDHRPPFLTAATSAAVSSTIPPLDQCENGKIFVYDLPSQFNSDLYKNCDKSSVWGNWCGALSNDGFGHKVTENNHLMPENLAGAWYSTDQFSSEVLFHNRLLFHKCRTLEPESATAYYIPFYAGIAVGKYMMDDFSPKDRDQHCEMMLEWVQGNYPYFNRSNGWDHFLVMGRITWDFRWYGDQGWGSRCITMPSMTNVTRLLIEKNPWDYFADQPSDVVLWQEFVRSRERRSLFCFAGGTRGWVENDFRGLLLSQCQDSFESCRLVDCSGGQGCGTSVILESFLDSEFCLQPRGDSFTRRSIFDCMLAGSIPVFFWKRSAYLQYEWFLPGESESYSVFIHRDEVRNGTLIKTVLEKYGKEEIKRMREKVVETIPKLIYAKPNEGLGSMKDAIDIAVDGVLKRIKEKKVWKLI
ncbi:xyloglucan galactosyltransferase XLT2-like [Chenopodium quinoa]|uniref:xyloglucan galactosyltransferase XLT2-like n=1 Tax=Chenopodium quinoa TaxID=63459 RepID=UPI000B7776D0|nr:xyloglucan galactosyltransferase XLT2-like [Chenopodium quinoa]